MEEKKNLSNEKIKIIFDNNNNKNVLHRKKVVNVKDKNKKFSLYGKGYIKYAKLHSNAHIPFKDKEKKSSNEITYCNCCKLPSYQKENFEKYSFCKSTPEDFSNCGIGISLYYFFFQFAILILFITTLIAAIPMIIMSEHYTRGLDTICEKFDKNSKNKKNITNLCNKEDSDWALRFRVNNIKNYRELFILINEDNNKKENEKNIKNVILNYSIVNFFCLITLFGVNIVYIIMVNAKNKQIDILNYSPSDFTLYCTNIKNSLQAFNYYRNLDVNKKYSNPTKTENENFKLFLKEQLLQNDEQILNIENINLCYKLEEFMELENEIQNIALKLFQIEHNPKLLLKNKEIENLDEKKYYEGILCCQKFYTY